MLGMHPEKSKFSSCVPILSYHINYLLVTHTIWSLVGSPPSGALKHRWSRPPTQNSGSEHPGRGSTPGGREDFPGEFPGGRKDSTGVEVGSTGVEVESTGVEGDRGKSPPLWTLPPKGEPTLWPALGTRGEGGTGGGGGTTWMSRDPPPSSLSAPGRRLLSWSMDVHLAVIWQTSKAKLTYMNTWSIYYFAEKAYIISNILNCLVFYVYTSISSLGEKIIVQRCFLFNLTLHCRSPWLVEWKLIIYNVMRLKLSWDLSCLFIL